MSIWDSVKPAKKAAHPTAVSLSADGRSLSVGWADGTSSELPARGLRQYCPCAGCVEEWSGVRTFDVATIAPEMKIIEMSPVGNYALAFTFGDMHRTGIFQWEYLKSFKEKHPDV